VHASTISGEVQLTVPQAYRAAGNAIYSSGAIGAVRVLAICLGLAGLYLTYIGWKPAPRMPQTVASATQDRPHAAGDSTSRDTSFEHTSPKVVPILNVLQECRIRVRIER
jgi:hypothetical protein